MIHHFKGKTIKFYELNAKFGNYELSRMKWVLDWGSPLFKMTKSFFFLSKTYLYFFCCKRQDDNSIPNQVGIKLSNYSYNHFSIAPVFIPQFIIYHIRGKMDLYQWHRYLPSHSVNSSSRSSTDGMCSQNGQAGEKFRSQRGYLRFIAVSLLWPRATTLLKEEVLLSTSSCHSLLY